MRAWPLPSVRMMKQRSQTSISFFAPTAKWLSGALRRAAMTLFLCVLTTATAWADITGSGTSSAPYVLSTAADWATFASNVNSGTNVDKCYRLSDSWDNSGSAVTATVGTSDHPFTGTFDGNGKTLNVSISETSTMGTAPFRYISGGAVIKNVTVTGTVAGTTHAAGLVGFSVGGTSENPNTIKDCTVNASVTVNTGDNKHMGGVVGHGITSYLKIKDTVFSGTMTNGGNYAGGLQGWSDGNHLTIDNCIFTGSYSGSGSFHPIAIHNAGSTTTATVSRCCYTAAPTLADAAFIAATGMQVSASVPSDVMYGQVTAADNQTYYASVTVSGVQPYYLYTGDEISVTYTVTAADGSVLTKGTDFAETFDPATVKNTGDYTLTVTGTGDYSGSQTFSFTVVDIPSTPSGLSVDKDYTYPSAGYFYVNMPTTGTTTVTLPDEFTSSFKVYDDGGKNGTHSNACRGTLILTAPEGYVLQLSGNIITESSDKLTVYDNNEASGNKLLDGVVSSGWDPFAGSPTQTAITTVTSTGQSMTLYFYSDNSGNFAGLDLTVTLIRTSTDYSITVSNPETGGTITSDKTTAKANENVTLTASPSEGYLLSDINVVDASNNAVSVTWNTWTNSATFTMPGSAVTVTPSFTNTLTADGGLYVNMPVTGSKSATIPAGVQSFKVYDDGGSAGNYSNDCSGTLVLTAPEGYVLQLSGSIRTQVTDMLTVYDGSNTSVTKLLDEVSSATGAILTAITTVTSTGQSMTLYFYSDDSFNHAGLDLTVTLISTSTDYSITMNNPETGGTVSRNKTTAKVNETVTLGASPSDGYLLNNISVVDANNNAVSVTWNIWTNSATFTMPGSAVTVTPSFTNDLTNLSVNMPAKGNKSATIPVGIQLFKVYDDGGSAGDYSYSCRGTLVLTAPEGYVLQLSGNITTETSDNLTVYDGSTNSGTKLLDAVSSTSNNTQTAITTITSSGQSMTLYFYSDQKYNYAGLDLTVTVVKVMALTDNADNSAVIDSWNGGVANVTLSGRTLYKDGDWNTLCLPFGVSDFTGTPLADATVMELDTDGDYSGNKTGFDAADGTLYLYFKDATEIEAGKPYIVKWTDGDDIYSPVFSAAAIDNSSEAQARNTVSARNSGLRTVQYIGSYSPVALTPGDKSNLFLGTESTLYYPDAANSTDGLYHVNACRAYFHVDLTGAANAVRAFVLGFGDDGNAGDPVRIHATEAGEDARAPQGWYTLDGRRLSEKPKTKGLYIYGNKKVMIK